MTENIVRTHRNIVDGVLAESNSLKAGISLLYDVLTFDRGNVDAVSEAQDHMYFIAAALGDLQKRLDRLGAEAHALLIAEKTTA